MIVRIMGQGQWVLEPEHLMELNELDRALEDRVAAGDEPGMLEALKGLVEGARNSNGTERISTLRRELQESMDRNAQVFRTEDTLIEVTKVIADLRETVARVLA